MNFANRYVKLKLSIAVNENSVRLAGSKKTVLTSNNVMDENSFRSPKKVIFEALKTRSVWF